MTSVTRETSFNTATIWPFIRKLSYGQIEYGAPYRIQCTYEQGSSKQYRDASGKMYIPASIFWYERPEQGVPSLTDYIALGDHTLSLDPNLVNDAEIIKNAILQDSAVLGDTPDVMVLT